MYKKDMSHEQLEERKKFLEKLVNAGWDIGLWDELFETGTIDISPEGHACLHGAKANFELSYHAQERYLSFLLGAEDLQDFIKFRFYYGNRLTEVLALITDEQSILSRRDYKEFIKKIIPLCDDVLMEVQAGGLIRLSL